VVETREDGSQLVYQKPGPWNALGLVKFLFPNDYSIYMHDTNRRDLFKNTIRAYSHGCMRVENALEMARFIFEKDGRLTSDKFDAVMKTRTERGFALRTKIPVHVEYNTVSVDDAGHMMFFLDVYKYDQAFREGQVPLRGAKPIAREG
jgi:murein L,D-transpeptidase YcbB/YkuD